MPNKPSITRVIVNNTPLVALWSINHLSVLKDLYTQILIPPAVHNEFLAVESSARQAVLDKSPWIKITSLQNPRQTKVYVGLDLGEAEVLALAIEQSARLVIIDEHKDRRYAQRLDLPITGTLGVLLTAKSQGFIPALTPLLNQLLTNGLYIKPDLITRVLDLAGE